MEGFFVLFGDVPEKIKCTRRGKNSRENPYLKMFNGGRKISVHCSIFYSMMFKLHCLILFDIMMIITWAYLVSVTVPLTWTLTFDLNCDPWLVITLQSSYLRMSVRFFDFMSVLIQTHIAPPTPTPPPPLFVWTL